MGMGDNIGDWYYPRSNGDTPDGLSLLPNNSNDSVPYQSLKCTNQIGLVVDGNVTEYQGIVRCTTTITGLNRQSNYFLVYSDDTFNNYREFVVYYEQNIIIAHNYNSITLLLLYTFYADGPTLSTKMRLFLLTSTDTEFNIMFNLSFVVSNGVPSKIKCVDADNIQTYFPHIRQGITKCHNYYVR